MRLLSPHRSKSVEFQSTHKPEARMNYFNYKLLDGPSVFVASDTNCQLPGKKFWATLQSHFWVAHNANNAQDPI